ncbi:MAG: valine--tRNA ligase [Deltaproteobacteria bacterium]|nr:valine--tRNA ligase [Deltaproteobacteria bacterium]
MALDKIYDPSLVEKRWFPVWMERGYFRPEQNPTGKPFSMVIPPPNITGSLHMGHALNNTLQDILARYKRMDGYQVLWLPGTDHAGIATQNVVERQLMEQGTDRWQLGREKFVERVWTWRDESGGHIVHQLKALGTSCDWSRERFTMDEGLSRAVREVFVRLYEEGLIYRGRYLINWCPRCQTALSDLEVEPQESDGHLYHLSYPRTDGKGAVTIATTRPETLLGDTAVAVHPEDERYRDLIGKMLTLPLVGREIPVIADTHADKEFGTGALKVTPAHDFTDFEIGKQHGLEAISILDEQARMTTEAGSYVGMDRYACRTKIVEDLQQSGALIRTEPYKIMLGHCYRCRTVVEPFLSNQWFVKIKPLADVAIAAVKDGRTTFFPTHWEKTYFAWMENIRDWCISRQLWWGHRIPAWYCDACGEMMVSRTDVTACRKCGAATLSQETDVLDTWFSSGLWPFSTMGWPDQTVDLKAFYPTSTLVTGFDIIFFWVARMMMLGLKFMGEVPFRHIYIHALVRDERGQKMSKSKGNVIDPLEVMAAYGTDALRFTLTAQSAMGRDIRLSADRITGYRNFANKVWNAARFVLMQGTGDRGRGMGEQESESKVESSADVSQVSGLKSQVSTDLADRWILSRLNRTITDVRQALDDYRFNEVAALLYQFIWHEFCDWYLELSKISLDSDEQVRERTRAVLETVLDTALRLLHPVMPFMTEEIWHALHPDREADSIMVQPYPTVDVTLIDHEVERRMNVVMEVIRAVRNIRSEMNLPPSLALTAVVISSENAIEAELRTHEAYVQRLARLGEIRYQTDGERPRGAALAVIDGAEIHVPLAGLVNLQEESKRLEKEIAKAVNDLAGIHRKLGDAKFIERAPEEVVEEQRDRATQLEEKRQSLEKSVERLRQIQA